VPGDEKEQKQILRFHGTPGQAAQNDILLLGGVRDEIVIERAGAPA
jgi:hypothetical protein